MPELAVSVLAYAPPSVAREWATEHQLPAEVLEMPSRRAEGEQPISNARWMDAVLVDQIAQIAYRQGQHPDELRLLEEPITGSDWPDEQGVNQTSRIFFADGSDGYHKPFTGLDDDTAEDYGQSRPVQPIHEVAAWQLARELGPEWAELVPPCVLRVVDGQLGSLARGVTGNLGAGPTATRADLMARAGFFDALIGQQDRNWGNFITEGDRLHLIDHGFTFAVFGDPINMSYLHRERLETHPELHPADRAALDKLLSSPDLLGMENVLEPARARALRARAEIMRSTDMTLDIGDFGGS